MKAQAKEEKLRRQIGINYKFLFGPYMYSLNLICTL